MKRLALFVSTCGPLGYAPFAPGTVGSMAGLVLHYGIRWVGSVYLEIGATVGLFAVGLWSGTVAEHHFGGRDPSRVVLDEVVGMLVTLFLLPVTAMGAVVGFLLFRIFDVVKPFPAAQFERLPGGLGIMADDGVAAIYGNLILRGLILAVPGWFV